MWGGPPSKYNKKFAKAKKAIKDQIIFDKNISSTPQLEKNDAWKLPKFESWKEKLTVFKDMNKALIGIPKVLLEMQEKLDERLIKREALIDLRFDHYKLLMKNKMDKNAFKVIKNNFYNVRKDTESWWTSFTARKRILLDQEGFWEYNFNRNEKFKIAIQKRKQNSTAANEKNKNNYQLKF